ncbi:MAG: adenylate kinase [Candidatus Omnitrophota bacterium]|jgi:adenylate kinase
MESPEQIAPTEDLEVKDAQLIFTNEWGELEEEYGHDNLRFPKEIILLGGAPGSGKGTHTSFIMKARGLTCPPIVVSDLLSSPEMLAIKESGGMVGDQEVVGILFRRMLEDKFRDGCVLDGFPRTRVQVECLKMLVSQINSLYREHYETPLAIHFRKPTIHAMVLFVDEKTSVDRQLKRGQEVQQHNDEVRASGLGETWEERATDVDPDKARHRYRVFKEKTWDALQSLKEIFHYHFVNAQGDIREVESNILDELRYQSSLELDPRTLDCIRHLPLATEIIMHARQDLVRRLDSYEIEHRELFHKVLDIITEKFIPIVLRHAISGLAVINSEDPVFEDALALAMVIDIFSERGFHAVTNINRSEVPDHVDLTTGKIHCHLKRIYRFQVKFKGSEIRRGGH